MAAHAWDRQSRGRFCFNICYRGGAFPRRVRVCGTEFVRAPAFARSLLEIKARSALGRRRLRSTAAGFQWRVHYLTSHRSWRSRTISTTMTIEPITDSAHIPSRATKECGLRSGPKISTKAG
jgi:hypothetical protein